jgi:hypothetical protein
MMNGLTFLCVHSTGRLGMLQARLGPVREPRFVIPMLPTKVKRFLPSPFSLINSL